MIYRRLNELIAGMLLSLLCGVACAAGWDEATLLEVLSQQSRPVVNFVEVRHLSYLDVPLQSRGQLEFRAPDYLRRTVSGGASFEISADRLILHEVSGGRREIGLDAYPGLRAFAESFRATLAGDLVRLHRYFRSELRGDKNLWELSLSPLDPSVASVISQISLFGRAGIIERIETRERGGDYTVTRLEMQP